MMENANSSVDFSQGGIKATLFEKETKNRNGEIVKGYFAKFDNFYNTFEKGEDLRYIWKPTELFSLGDLKTLEIIFARIRKHIEYESRKHEIPEDPLHFIDELMKKKSRESR